MLDLRSSATPLGDCVPGKGINLEETMFALHAQRRPQCVSSTGSRLTRRVLVPHATSTPLSGVVQHGQHHWDVGAPALLRPPLGG
jgi:hypothetical protein